MLRIIAILIGIVFIFAGVAGNMPMFMQDGLLLGYLQSDSYLNLVHIITGVLAIMAATSHNATRLFFKIFGLAYAIVGVWGIWQNGEIYTMHMNMADNIFHLVIGLISLYMGFASKRDYAG